VQIMLPETFVPENEKHPLQYKFSAPVARRAGRELCSIVGRYLQLYYTLLWLWLKLKFFFITKSKKKHEIFDMAQFAWNALASIYLTLITLSIL